MDSGSGWGGAVGRRFRNNSLAKVVEECRPVLGSDDRKLAGLVGLTFVMGLLEAILILLVVQMAVALAAGHDRFDLLFGPVSLKRLPLLTGAGCGVVFVLLLVACLVPMAAISGRLAASAQHRTRRRLVRAYLGASWEVRSHYPEGHLQELLTTYSQRAERAVNQLVLMAVAFCGLLAILLVAFISSAVVAALAIVCVGGVGALLRPVVARTRSASASYARADRTFAARMAEIARITPEITAFDVAEPVAMAVEQRSAEVAESLRKIRIYMRLGAGLYQYLALLLVVVAIGAAALFADPGTLATVGTVLLLLVRAMAYGQQLQAQIQAAGETAPFLEKMGEEITTLEAAVVERGGTLIEEPVPLRFENVWFGYDLDQDVLRGVSFDIRPGEALGIVGPSGAGKSTLVGLLLRLRQPSRGRLVAAGAPLDHVALARWYELIAYVPQENKLISGTVADNIRFFRQGIGDDAVREAAKRAHLLAQIEELPDGFDTMIGPGIRDLSGGQRQRLGIARALAAEPRLIILDEPTSSLDARSEMLVAQTLADLRGFVTTVIVAHRPATTTICDRVVRIEDGRASLVSSDAERTALIGELTE